MLVRITPGRCLFLLAVMLLLVVGGRSSTVGAAASVPDATITVDTSVPAMTSALNLGATQVFGTFAVTGSMPLPTPQALGEQILTSTVGIENRHIFGWGLGDPEPAPGRYNWTDLDKAVAEMRRLTSGGQAGTMMLTLCCAPGWMTQANSDQADGEPAYTSPVSPTHYSDFATLAVSITQRYPDIHYYQIWNELKGFTGASRMQDYDTFYNTIYDALKAYNPTLNIGGPYINLIGGYTTSYTVTDAQPMQPYEQDNIQTWLQQRRNASFFALDDSIVDQNGTPPALPTIMASTPRFETITRAVRGLIATTTPSPGATPASPNLPIWWSEDYCDVNQGRLGYMSDSFQGACLGSLLLHELKGGASASIRWSPGGDGYANLTATPAANKDVESLFTDPRFPAGGQPYPAAAVYKAFHDYFGPGTPIYATTSSTPMVEALSSLTTTLLINKDNLSHLVAVNGTVIALNPYQVAVVPLLLNGSFEAAGGSGSTLFPSWTLGVRSGAQASISQAQPTDVPSGSGNGQYAAQVVVTQSNSNLYYVQLGQSNVSLQAGKAYTLTFWAKASTTFPIQVALQQTGGSYQTYFLSSTISPSVGWTKYVLSVPAAAYVDGDTSLRFNLAGSTGTVWIDNVSLVQQ